MDGFDAIQTATAFDGIWDLLALCLGGSDAARREALGRRYLGGGPHRLWCLRDGTGPVGVVGVRVEASAGEITHLAVRCDRRRRGVGRALVEAARRAHPAVRAWSAETDDDAVAFYRRLGFKIVDLGERYPGVRRYRCVVDASPGAATADGR